MQFHMHILALSKDNSNIIRLLFICSWNHDISFLLKKVVRKNPRKIAAMKEAQFKKEREVTNDLIIFLYFKTINLKRMETLSNLLSL